MSKAEGLPKNFRGFLLVIVLGAVVYLVVRNIGVFGNVLLVLLGFGAVVLVHELGHFIFAKLFGIKVEAFSIGFPPVLFGIRKTEVGYRVRILPKFFPKENDESGDGLLSFTIGRCAKAGPVSPRGSARSKRGKQDAPPVVGTSNGAGETEYRVGLIPFGGFNKILGQDDTGEAKASDDPRSYANKPVGSRMVVIAAGVTFNAISAILVFMLVFLIGINLTPAVVGGVEPNSPAERAGLKAGDEIIEIAGESEYLDYRNILMAPALSGRDEEIPLKVRREDGSIEDFSIVAELLPGKNMRDFGITPPLSLTIAKLSEADANDLHAKTGLIPGDRIKAVNAQEVQTYWGLERVVRDALVPAVTVFAERGEGAGNPELIESQIKLDLIVANREVKSESDLSHICSMVPRLRITVVAEQRSSDSRDSEASLQKGDIILAIGDVENPTYQQMREVTERHEDKELVVKVLRTGPDGSEKPVTVTVVPKRPRGADRVLIGIFVAFDAEHPVVAKTIDAEGRLVRLAIPGGAVITMVDGEEVSNFYEVISKIRQNAGERISIDWRLDEETAGDVALDVGEAEEFITVKSVFAEPVPFQYLQRLYKASGPADAISIGYKKTVMLIIQTYVTVRRLIEGLVSTKELSGPVGIIAISYRIASEQPLIYYVYFLGLISALIAVFNSLPILPFDGGHIVLLLIEKIKGSPLSERVQGVVAYAGLAFIIAFFLYLTFNDIVNNFFAK